MAERNRSADVPSMLYLVTAVIWGFICIVSVWLDLHVRHVPLTLWRKCWDFVLTPVAAILNVYIFAKRRSRERVAG